VAFKVFFMSGRCDETAASYKVDVTVDVTADVTGDVTACH